MTGLGGSNEIVAAMILGIASFGHKGVIFPLLVRAIGVIASIISTYSVRAGDKGTAGEAMKSVNKGFLIGSAISVLGFILLGISFGQSSGSVASNFSRAYRYTASALTSDLAWLFGAGFAPLAALILASRFGLLSAGVYLLSGAVCTLLVLAFNRRIEAQDS